MFISVYKGSNAATPPVGCPAYDSGLELIATGYTPSKPVVFFPSIGSVYTIVASTTVGLQAGKVQLYLQGGQWIGPANFAVPAPPPRDIPPQVVPQTTFFQPPDFNGGGGGVKLPDSTVIGLAIGIPCGVVVVVSIVLMYLAKSGRFLNRSAHVSSHIMATAHPEQVVPTGPVVSPSYVQHNPGPMVPTPQYYPQQHDPSSMVPPMNNY